MGHHPFFQQGNIKKSRLLDLKSTFLSQTISETSLVNRKQLKREVRNQSLAKNDCLLAENKEKKIGKELTIYPGTI